jgi:uncharacterized protein YceH (UPF0502 family)
MELSGLQVRVVGALAEKERTVPDGYPLTLNSLVSACNQSSNRWPVMQVTASDVRMALEQLKAAGFARFVHPARGERSTKYRQVLDERLDLDAAAMAALTVLMVRGPQTAGEIRTRADRLHPFGSVDAVLESLGRLAEREEPLVELLERRPGERDQRWTHLLAGDPGSEAMGPAPGQPAPEQADGTPAGPKAASKRVEPAVVEELTARVARLEAQVARLHELLGEDPEPPRPTDPDLDR